MGSVKRNALIKLYFNNNRMIRFMVYPALITVLIHNVTLISSNSQCKMEERQWWSQLHSFVFAFLINWTYIEKFTYNNYSKHIIFFHLVISLMHTYACFKQILRIKTYHYNKKFWLFHASDIVHLLPCYENNFRM